MIETIEQVGTGGRISTPGAVAPVLRLDGIVKRWRSDLPPVLAGVTLEVAPGSVIAIGGRNGAGKTTLLRIASGLLLPDEGSVHVCGLAPARRRSQVNRRLGFLLAGNSGLYARLNVEHHLDLWGRLALMEPASRRESIADVTAMFALDELRGIRVDRLSMGQRQRLRLAMTFLHRPELVLLDEPYTSLDGDAIGMLRTAVRSLCERGGSAIVCAPEPEPAKLAHDRAFVIAGGLLREAR